MKLSRCDARVTEQHPQRHVSDTIAAGTCDAQMRAALALRFGDRAGAPVRIEFHDAVMIAHLTRGRRARAPCPAAKCFRASRWG